MVLGDHRQWRSIGVKPQLLHALAGELADRVWRPRLLIIVLRKPFSLPGDGTVQSEKLLRLRVVGLKHVVVERPVDDMGEGVSQGVTLELASLISGLQLEIPLGKAQRDRPIELGAAAHYLRRVTLDRHLGAVLGAVGVRVDVWLVVEVGLDMAGEEASPRVVHSRGGDDTLRACIEHFVALEIAEPSRPAFVLGAKQRPLLEHQDRLACPGKLACDWCTSGATADNDDIKLITDHWRLPQPLYSVLAPSGGSIACAQSQAVVEGVVGVGNVTPRKAQPSPPGFPPYFGWENAPVQV